MTKSLSARVLAVATLTILTFAVDLSLPLGVAGGIPYVIVVLLTHRLPGRQPTFAIASLTSALVLVGYFLSPDGGIEWMVLANRGLALLAIWVGAVLVARSKRAEYALREREELYRDFVEGTDDLVTRVDADGRFTFVNSKAEEVFGLSPAECVGLYASEFVHPDDRKATRDAFDGWVRDKPTSITYENRQVSRSGQVRHLLWTVNVHHDESGRVTHLNGIARDITERKRAEDEIGAIRHRLELGIERMPVAYILWDSDGMISHWNPAAERIFGFTREEAAGKSFLELVVPEEVRPVVADVMRSLVAGEEVAYSEPGNNFRKDGSVISCRWFNTPLAEPTGEVSGVLSMALEVTEELALQEHQKLLATAVEHADEVIIITDPSGNIQYVNPAFETLTGYTRDEVIGANPSILQSGQQDRAFYESMWETLVKGRVWAGRLINRTKGGVLFEEDATISPVLDAGGNIVNYVAVKRDVTREAALEARLVQTQKMEAIGTLAGGIAHDFNNLLQIMLGYLDLAQADLPVDSPAAQPLAEVVTAGNRAIDLVDQILAFSRQSKKERRPVRLQSILKEVLKLLRASLPSTIEIRHSIDAGCGPVMADPTEVHQVALNLCTNAYHAMRETGGVLEVRLEEMPVNAEATSHVPGPEEGRKIRFSVRDTGTGIDATTLDRIFDPYFTTKEVGEGTGLGLATVHSIVEAYGGTVTVESEVGVGTLFEVYLPLASSTANSGGEIEVDEGAQPVGTERILLVDDEPMVVDLVRRGLGRLGYNIEAHTSSLKALEVFRADPARFDVVITDQTMPRMSGFELANLVLLIRPDMPVILCTGFSEVVDETTAKAAGIREYLRKPVLPRALAAAVRKVLDVT